MPLRNIATAWASRRSKSYDCSAISGDMPCGFWSRASRFQVSQRHSNSRPSTALRSNSFFTSTSCVIATKSVSAKKLCRFAASNRSSRFSLYEHSRTLQGHRRIQTGDGRRLCGLAIGTTKRRPAQSALASSSFS